MSKANSFDGDVYTGVWTDWTQGRIQGSTLTLTRQSGALLIAFLAIFVGAAGRGYWKIVRYLLHLALAKETSVDGVYHQRQAVLRNTGLAMDAGLDLLYMRLAWRNRTNKADKKLTSIAALAFLSAGCFHNCWYDFLEKNLLEFSALYTWILINSRYLFLARNGRQQ